MGGLSGHMMHPYDNLRLSKEELKDMIRYSLSGQIKFSEKIDGYNIHVTYLDNQVKFARNKKDLQNGGMTVADMILKWKDKPHTLKVYLEAAKILVPYIESIKDKINWYHMNQIVTLNCECLIPGETNIISYPDYRVYVHNIWIWDTSEFFHSIYDEKCEELGATAGIYFKQNLQYKFDHHGTSAMYCYAIDELFGNANTIEELYQYKYIQWLKENASWVFEDLFMAKVLFDRFFKRDKSVNLKTIKEAYLGHPIDELCKEGYKTILRYCQNQLKRIICLAGNDILGGVTGYINEDNKYEVCHKIHQDLKKCTSDYLYNEWYYDYNGVINPLEGVVFNYKGMIYKWTGYFFIINKMLGKIKYETL